MSDLITPTPVRLDAGLGDENETAGQPAAASLVTHAGRLNR